MNRLTSTKTIRLLQTFEVVGRKASVSKASKELGLTTSAVSHQLRELTEIIGAPLTEKAGRGIALTSVGAKLTADLAEHFDNIARSVMKAVSGGDQRMRIAVCSAFGPGWLAPRFERLLAEFPEVDFQLVLKMGQPELNDSEADLFITTRPGATGFWTTPLFEETLIAVGSAERHRADPRLKTSRLITTEILDGMVGDDWRSFIQFTRMQVDLSSPHLWLKCSHYILALELIRANMGVALLPEFLVTQDIAAGTLVQFDRRNISSGRQYHICVKKSRMSEPNMIAVSSWLKKSITSLA